MDKDRTKSYFLLPVLNENLRVACIMKRIKNKKDEVLVIFNDADTKYVAKNNLWLYERG